MRPLNIAKILLLQALILLALSAAGLFYVEWSSDAAWEEFSAALKAPSSGPAQPAPFSVPVQPVNGQKICLPKPKV